MPGTVAGGLRASNTNKKKHGKDFYKRIGALGGTKSRGGGFANRTVGADGLTLAQRAGATGGRTSRRGKANDTTS